MGWLIFPSCLGRYSVNGIGHDVVADLGGEL
jgi:hypothetical protein